MWWSKKLFLSRRECFHPEKRGDIPQIVGICPRLVVHGSKESKQQKLCFQSVRRPQKIGTRIASHLSGFQTYAEEELMSNTQHGKIAKQGTEAWNKWRAENGDLIPDISGEQLHRIDLRESDLSEVNMTETLLTKADFGGANLQRANLKQANLWGANLSGANLRGANLRGANLRNVKLNGADLQNADLAQSELLFGDLTGANLKFVDLSGAMFVHTDLTGTDLRGANLRDIQNWNDIKSIDQANVSGVIDSPDGFLEWAKEKGAIDDVSEDE